MTTAVETTVTIKDDRGHRGENLKVIAAWMRTTARNQGTSSALAVRLNEFAPQLEKIAAEWLELMAKAETPDRVRSALDDLKGQIDDIIGEID